jgi:hypothetical protein
MQHAFADALLHLNQLNTTTLPAIHGVNMQGGGHQGQTGMHL